MKLDQKTAVHCRRTESLCNMLCRVLNLNNDIASMICLAAEYHDIGKSKIPASILFKPGKLTDDEWKIMKTHAKIGYDLMTDLPENVRLMILYHHEDINGGGYYHLNGNQIPIGSQILRICDVYDALTSDRCYRKSLSPEAAISYLNEQSGILFPYHIVQAFINGLRDTSNGQKYAL